ncbi:hypothetical protein [Macrococcus bovicus]|uniref:Uncharacterized protein n=1 Tax=Macrococcus bovicus TaxID=69968 RepID=A0A4R6C333_9STAP|nr:hypothetical protein [Macrococcus bovicus]TDM15755.1 hypothetical protein ERX55_02280 [Macrococcus bovicus]
MNKKLSLQEAWHDYITNFFRPKAPISYEMYRKQNLITIPLAVLFFVVWSIIFFKQFVASDTSEMTEVYQSFIINLIFLILVSLIHFSTFTLELRMFNRRQKSPLPYIVMSFVFLIGGLIYCVTMYMLEIKVTTFYLLVVFWVLLFMNNKMYVGEQMKKEDAYGERIDL